MQTAPRSCTPAHGAVRTLRPTLSSLPRLHRRLLLLLSAVAGLPAAVSEAERNRARRSFPCLASIRSPACRSQRERSGWMRVRTLVLCVRAGRAADFASAPQAPLTRPVAALPLLCSARRLSVPDIRRVQLSIAHSHPHSITRSALRHTLLPFPSTRSPAHRAAPCPARARCWRWPSRRPTRGRTTSSTCRSEMSRCTDRQKCRTGERERGEGEQERKASRLAVGSRRPVGWARR